MKEKKVQKVKAKKAHEFGNTFEFAAGRLQEHWRALHKGRHGGTTRVYDCMVCRDLWMRASSALADERDEVRATPYGYGYIAVEALRRSVKQVVPKPAVKRGARGTNPRRRGSHKG